ncbi:IS30 family transposase [Rhodococcus erythropolis]|uniref:IS30 family transposase n=1 Tax=Rhodococcus erythropolis TaxID=1833 RepID=UPI0029493112|nr:IS30 family transposase [Rhodococcus erythropolis]MDV6278761.1 IS30 family transposase [Rhodococcus erythropolis]
MDHPRSSIFNNLTVPRTEWHVCVETFYEAVYRGLVLAATGGSLRTGRTYRRGRGRGRSRDGSLKQSTNLTPIAQRPAHVQSRRQVGHIEGDLIIGTGQRSAIATLVERKTRLTIAIRGGHSAQVVGDALIARFTQMPVALRRSLIWDQGNEMFQHERIAAATGLKIYFADPHSPWQRGSNENMNGLLDWSPKVGHRI